MNKNRIGQVMSSAPDTIVVNVESLKTFEENKNNLQVGRYLSIAQGNNDFVIAVIKNIKGYNTTSEGQQVQWLFSIECQAVGTLIGGNTFERGTSSLPVPTEPAYVVTDDTFNKLFISNENLNFQLGFVSANKKIPFKVDGDKFFGKHIAVVGSTGSGKSYTVAKIIQDIVGICNKENA